MGEVFELSPHFSARIGNPPATFDGALERLGLSGTHFAGRAKLGGLDVFVKYRTIRPASRMRIFTRRFVEGFAAPRVIEWKDKTGTKQERDYHVVIHSVFSAFAQSSPS